MEGTKDKRCKICRRFGKGFVMIGIQKGKVKDGERRNWKDRGYFVRLGKKRMEKNKRKTRT